MTTRIEATAAPATVRIGGTEYKLSPLTDEDRGILDQWVRSRHMKIARDSLDANAPMEQRELTERVALSQASTLSFMSGHGASLMGTVEGMAQLFWCAMRRYHPELTPSDVAEMVTNPENLEEFQSEFERLNNIATQEDETKRQTVKKKKAARRKATRTARKSRRANR